MESDLMECPMCKGIKNTGKGCKLWSGHGTLDEEDMKAIMTLNNLKRFATKEEMQKIEDHFHELRKWHDEEEQTNYAELKNDLD